MEGEFFHYVKVGIQYQKVAIRFVNKIGKGLHIKALSFEKPGSMMFINVLIPPVSVQTGIQFH